MIVSCDAASSSRWWAARRRIGRSSLTGSIAPKPSGGSIFTPGGTRGLFACWDCRPTGEGQRRPWWLRCRWRFSELRKHHRAMASLKPSTPWTQGQNDEISTTPISGSGSRRAAMPTVSALWLLEIKHVRFRVG